MWQQLVHGSGGGIYLETAATVTTFLLAGRLYEARARRIAGEAMRELAATAARDVCVLGLDGAERRMPVGQLRPGDLFVVRPGETIAADGEVQFGQSAVDRSMMTGESVPADAAEGDSVTGGTVALTGRLVVRADKTGKDTQLSQLIRLVEQAQAQKANIQRAADRICGVFVPAVLAGAALTLAGWLLAGSPAEHAFSAGAGRPDHRVPVRSRARDPHGAGGSHRTWRATGHFHQGLPGPGNIQVGHRGGAGQDRDRHHREDVRGGRPPRRRGGRRPTCSATREPSSRRPSTRSPRRSARPRRQRPGRCRRPTGSGHCPDSARGEPSTAARSSSAARSCSPGRG